MAKNTQAKHPVKTTAPGTQNHTPIVIWLFSCAFMVFAMMVIGAITRLTESGLSMVEWRPLIGALPPLNEAEWTRVFALYQQSPEFQKVNSWMALSDFKTIFFWEWLHRLWGRTIGIAYAMPLIVFWLRGMIPPGYKLKFLGLFILGGLQGFMGWYMVKSGLIDQPAVSHFRLAAHLALAFLIFAFLFSFAQQLRLKNYYPNRALHVHTWLVLICLGTTILWGAFTAGLDAGLIYNDTFPKMGGQWMPPDFWKYDTVWMNMIKNHSAVQFTHRWLAITTVTVTLSLWGHGVLKKAAFPALHAAALMALTQMGLGITTLFSGVHIHIAATHQAGALILFALLLTCLIQTQAPKKTSENA